MIELDKKDDWLNYSFCAENLELLGKLDLQAEGVTAATSVQRMNYNNIFIGESV